MNIITAPAESQSLVSSIIAPIESILRTANNLALSLEEVSETILDASKLAHEIATLSLTAQRNELMLRQ